MTASTSAGSDVFGRKRLSSDEICGLTAIQTVCAIREGWLSAEHYIETLLQRAEAISHLNAFITLNRAGAFEAAERIDRAVREGADLPPLAGLAIVVKDNINTRDLPTSGGTAALRNSRPKTTAPTLQRLLDAGVIVLGKTNMHELAFGITSTNLSSFAGPVRNPYDTNRIPGGSSGGTAVAVAARVVACGLGSDTGASTRLPAALTGTVGFRPSVGNGGSERRYHDVNAVVPVSHTRDTLGPMGRTVEDVALLDAAVTGGQLASAVPLRGLRLGVPATFWRGLDKQVASVMEAARLKLVAAGVVLVDVDTVGLSALNERVSFTVALHEPNLDVPAYFAASGIEGITLADIALQISSPDVKAAYAAILDDVFAPEYEDAMKIHRPALQALYRRYFADNRLDAIMFPTAILPAVPIDLTEGSSTVSIDGGPASDTFSTFIRNTDPASNAGIPGLSIPAGLTADGLPVGLELDGPLGSDTKLLGIGMSVESLLGPLPAPNLATQGSLVHAGSNGG